MPLYPPISEPERILLYGGPGASKTTSWLDIAKYYSLTGTPGHFYVLDTDSTTSRMIQTSYSQLTNITCHTAFDWPDTANTKPNIMPKPNPTTGS